MLALESGSKYRVSVAERFDCTETITKLLAEAYQNPISDWQVTVKLHLVAGYKAMSPSTVCGKTIFHKTGPSCQNGWGPLT